MFCVKCGRSMPNDVKFCPFCGTKTQMSLDKSTEVVNQTPFNEGNPSSSEGNIAGEIETVKLSNAKKRNAIIIIATIFVVTIGVIAGITQILKYNPSRSILSQEAQNQLKKMQESGIGLTRDIPTEYAYIDENIIADISVLKHDEIVLRYDEILGKKYDNGGYMIGVDFQTFNCRFYDDGSFELSGNYYAEDLPEYSKYEIHVEANGQLLNDNTQYSLSALSISCSEVPQSKSSASQELLKSDNSNNRLSHIPEASYYCENYSDFFLSISSEGNTYYFTVSQEDWENMEALYWTFSGQLDKNTNSVHYDNCTIISAGMSHEDNILYENGTGEIWYENDSLGVVWCDDEMGETLVFHEMSKYN